MRSPNELSKSVHSGMGPWMWRALRKVQFWSWKRISCASPWEVEWTKKIEMARQLHTLQPQILEPTEEIRHRCPTIIPPNTVTSNNIASWLLCVSKAPMDKNHVRATKSSIRGLKSTLTTDPALSANFNINELESALKFIRIRYHRYSKTRQRWFWCTNYLSD
jgi:hypothetical protein